MEENKLNVVKYIKELIASFDMYLDNFPKKDIEIKHNLKNSSFEILKLIYIANSSRDVKKRVSYFEDAIGNIAMIDYYINMCYEKKIINSKRYIRFGGLLTQIVKCINGLKKVSLNVG